MNRKRVVFVDDEPAVLESLRTRLRKQRDRWDMVFAANGETALAELRKAPTDVIVSDMRMPGMDGATLLNHAMTEFPGVARIVLSGQSEKAAVMRAFPATQQFLAKPCDADMLCTAIERASEMQELLGNHQLQAMVGQLKSLPSAPKLYHELSQLLDSDKYNTSHVAALVRRDPAMSARVLQLVSSAYFGSPQRNIPVERAVSLLGGQTLRDLALLTGVFGAFRGSPIAGFSIDTLQAHSLHVGTIAKMICEPAHADDAFTAGLLHDVGRLVLCMSAPQQMAEAIALSKNTGKLLWRAEMDVMGVSHGAVGAYLLGIWALPSPIVEAVYLHHAPQELQHPAGEVLLAVHVANALAHATPGSDAWRQLLDDKFVQHMNANGKIDAWFARVQSLPAEES